MPLFRAGQRHLVGAVGEQVEHVARRAEERKRGRQRHLVDAIRQKQSLLRLTQGTKDNKRRAMAPTDLSLHYISIDYVPVILLLTLNATPIPTFPPLDSQKYMPLISSHITCCLNLCKSMPTIALWAFLYRPSSGVGEASLRLPTAPDQGDGRVHLPSAWGTSSRSLEYS